MKELIKINIYIIRDVKMVETKYLSETDTLWIKIGDAEETVDFKDFMDSIGAQRARLENILARIDEVRMNRVTETDKFMLTVNEIMKKQAKIRDMMEAATDSGDYKKNAALQKVHKALLDEKNTFREIRYAIKLLDTDEAKVKAELLELLG